METGLHSACAALVNQSITNPPWDLSPAHPAMQWAEQGLGARPTGPPTHFVMVSALAKMSLYIWVSHEVVLKLLRGDESNAAVRKP